jgi:hypothetical protein
VAFAECLAPLAEAAKRLLDLVHAAQARDDCLYVCVCVFASYVSYK